jgi:hypothetical protein
VTLENVKSADKFSAIIQLNYPDYRVAGVTTVHQSLIIIDDALNEAERLRELALSMSYPQRAANDFFPGRNSERSIRIELLEALAMQVTGEKLVPTCDHYGKFRLSLAGDQGRGGIHVDQCHWSAILYLSHDEHSTGGTDFYRHKETNSEHAPYTHSHLKRWGYTSYQDFVDRVSRPQAKDMSKWEHVMQVPMRFNRLVLFRPWLWHNAGPGFGTSPADGRLIHLLFFNNADIAA